MFIFPRWGTREDGSMVSQWDDQGLQRASLVRGCWAVKVSLCSRWTRLTQETQQKNVQGTEHKLRSQTQVPETTSTPQLHNPMTISHVDNVPSSCYSGYSQLSSSSQLPGNSKVAQPTIKGAAWPLLSLFMLPPFLLSFLALLISFSLFPPLSTWLLYLLSFFLPFYNKALKP